MYKIGDFSRLSGVSVKALRFYDHECILKPEYIDAFTGYRYYSSVQLNDIHRVIALKDMGFSLQEIRGLREQLIKDGAEIHNESIVINCSR